jgi:hypothetical protein
VLLLLLVAACVTAAVRNSAIALYVAGFVLLIIAGSGLQGGRGGRRAKSLGERRAEFHPIDRRGEATSPMSAQAEDELWARERERYRQSSSES